MTANGHFTFNTVFRQCVKIRLLISGGSRQQLDGLAFNVVSLEKRWNKHTSVAGDYFEKNGKMWCPSVIVNFGRLSNVCAKALSTK